MAKRRTKRKRRQTNRRLPRRPSLLTLAIVGGLAAFVVLIAISLATQGAERMERIQDISAEGRTRGIASAPVTIIEFADYQCPYCKRFAETTERQIEQEYIANELVRLEFRNMALIGPESRLAALAAQCANDQDMFWEYHDKLFEEQRAENSGTFSPGRLIRYAGELGLDQESFESCVSSGQYEQLVLDEMEAGQDAGVTSTPWFFINGETVRGNQPYEEFQRVIEEKLEEATSPTSSWLR